MLRDLNVLHQVGSLVGLTDRQLLERFQAASIEGDQAPAEAALTALVERHAAMVWNVCRSLIGDRPDAEDAFQATFLILVRKAGRLRIGETLGPWLHVVAHRTALSVRTAAGRRRRVERSAAATIGEIVETPDSGRAQDVGDDIRAAIHAEIGNLPEAFRAAVVLCDLEGLSYLEAAGRLRIPMGTLQSRLARARRRLRRKLTLRGMDPANGGESIESRGAPIVAPLPIGGPPVSLVGRVGRIGSLIASDPASLKAGVADPVRVLVAGGLRSMFFGKLQRVLVAALGGILVGVTVLYTYAWSGQTAPEERKPASRGETQRRDEIPAPGRLAVATGRGRTLVYQRDGEGERVPRDGQRKNGPFREVDRDIRWAVVTGVMDHRKVQEALNMADRKPPPPVHRLYVRIELERQTRWEEDSWSGWKRVDADTNLGVLDNLPEVEAERVPESFRPTGLVDPLPYLKQGEWRGVDVEDFVPPGVDAKKRQPLPQAPPKDARRDSPDVLMVRSLDFTVEPGRTYRYRARVVLFNPDFRPPAMRGVVLDNPDDDPRHRLHTHRFLLGPWSEPTGPVTIPAP